MGNSRDRFRKVQNKILGWETLHFSQAGRTCLLKSVSNIVKLNFAVENIHKDHFFLTKWPHMCLPVEYGGLGIHPLHLMNEAMLTRLAWRIISQPQSLVARALGANYGRGKGWWNTLQTSPSIRSQFSEASRGIEVGLKNLQNSVI